MATRSDRTPVSPPRLSLVRPATLGEHLRKARLKGGLKQADLANLLGVRSQTIGAWENGAKPQRRFFEPIAGFLELDGPDAVMALLEPGDVGARDGLSGDVL